MYTVSFSIISVSIFILIIGYIIRKRNMAHLVAGYDPEKVHDKAGYIKWASANIILVGIAGMLSGLGMLLLPHLTIYLIVGYVIAVGLLALVMVIGEKRYKRK